MEDLSSLVGPPGQLATTSRGSLKPVATSCTHAAHWVRLDPGRLRAANPTREAAPGGGGGNTIRELAHRARFSLTLSVEAWKGASKRVTYLWAPCISVRA